MNLVLFLALAIFAFIGLTLALAGQRKARVKWKESWDSNPNPNNSNNLNFEGNWSGSYNYNPLFTTPAYQEQNCSFLMTLRRKNNLVEGIATDSLGEAELEGVCDYPNIRITKSYVRSNKAGYEVGSHLGMLYYEGQIDTNNQIISGAWFTNPLSKSNMGGRFEMMLVSPLNETIEKDSEEVKTTVKIDKTTKIECEVKSEINTISNTIDTNQVSLEVDDIEKVSNRNSNEDKLEKVFTLSTKSNDKGKDKVVKTDTTKVVVKESFKLPASTIVSQTEGKDLIPKKSEIDIEDAIVQTTSSSTNLTSIITCKHCQAETPESYDFCLYCSQTVR